MENISKLTPILYEKNETNFNHNGLGKLTKLLAYEIDEVLNGEFEAFFEYPANGHLADKIDNEMYIKAKPNTKDEPHVFKIYDYELDTFTQTYLIYARSKNIEDLRNNVVLDVNVNGLNPTQAWNQAKSNALGSVVTTFYSDITTPSSVHWEHRTLLSIIAGQQGSMIQYWGGEIKHGVDWVGLYRRRGQDNITTVRYGKNLDGLKAVYSTKGLVTAIVPYFKKRDGQTIYGNVIESQYINNYPIIYYDVVEYSSEDLGLGNEEEYNDNDIKNILNAKSSNYFSEHVGKDLPSINMEISLKDISQTKEYEKFKNFEQIELGDTITVYSHKYKLNITAKVQRVVYNGLTDKNELVEVGTVRRSLYDDVREEFNRVEVSLQEGIDHAMASADGKNTIYHGTADPNEVGLVGKNNDTYFRTNGQFKEIWSYLDGQWHLEVGDLTGEQIKADIAEQQQEIDEAKEVADEAIEQINTAVANAGFTSLDETISSVQSISNTAQANAQAALGTATNAFTDAQTAIANAQEAVETTQGINVRVDEVEGTLALKADAQMVDTLTGIVETHGLDIQANAEELALKANQDTVDTLAGTVQSLGAQLDVTAGQISSKVWMADIDDIEIGGRNLLQKANVKRKGYVEMPSGSFIYIDKLNMDDSLIPVKPGEYLTASGDVKEVWRFYWKRSDGSILNYSLRDTRPNSDSVTIQVPNNENIAYVSVSYPAGDYMQLERGNKATDWMPAPEDTDAKIDYIETEWTQTFDSFSQTVSGIDGRVTSQKQTLDSIASTVSGHDSRISTVEQTASGLQSAVYNADGSSKITQLATGISSVVKGINNLLLDSGKQKITNSYHIASYDLSEPIPAGTDIVISIWGGLNPGVRTFGIWANNDTTHLVDLEFKGQSTDSSWLWTGKTKTPTELTRILVYGVDANYTDLKRIEKIKLEIGTVATDWSPAPEDVQSQITQLADNINLRVTKGELLSQINIEAGRTLIQSNRILLNASNTVITGTSWMDGAVIANASIDGAKIQDATIGSAKIASLDVSKISGNRSNFVQTYWNSSVGGNVRATGDGIVTTSVRNSQTYMQNGVVGSRNRLGEGLGHIGVDDLINDDYSYVLQTSYGTKFKIRQVMNSTTGDITWLDVIELISPSNINNSEAHIRSYNVYMQGHARIGQISMNDGNINSVDNIYSYYYRLRRGGYIRAHPSNSTVEIKSTTAISLQTDSGQAFRLDNTHGYMYRTLSMEGNSITNQSDRRLKFNIEETIVNSLEEIKSMTFVEFDRTNGNHDEIGVIAQDTPSLALYDSERDVWSINSSKQIMMNSHAIQQLDEKTEQQIHELSAYTSQALSETQQLRERIDELEQEIEQLKGVA